MTTPDLTFDARLLAVLDAIEEPVSIATAVRDRDMSTWRRRTATPLPA